MASSSSTTRMLSLKAILISTGVVSIAMALRFFVPLMLNFAVYELPEIWSLILSWLKPPYLYVVINGIIISIAASSRFHHHSSTTDQSEPLVRPISTPPSDLPPVLTQPAFISVLEPPVVYESQLPEVLDVEKPVIINGINTVEVESEFVISRSSWNPPARTDSMKHDQTEFVSPVKEKPLVSSRFGHRKPVKFSPEGGRALRVAKPKRQDTLENTWRTITDGRHMPLARHLKKSDTLENHGRQFHVSDPASPHVMRKAETIRDRTNFTNSQVEAVSSPVSSSPGSTGKLRKEASVGQDELNRRVEAFIKKFNEEMRLQRQESLNQYKEMITRGAH